MCCANRNPSWQILRHSKTLTKNIISTSTCRVDSLTFIESQLPLTEPYVRYLRIRLFKQSLANAIRLYVYVRISFCLSVHKMWPHIEPTACCPLRSPRFHRLHYYYETVRLLTGHQGLSIVKISIPLTLRSLPDLPGMQVLPSHARHALIPPAEPAQPRANGWALLSATYEKASTSALYYLRG